MKHLTPCHEISRLASLSALNGQATAQTEAGSSSLRSLH